MLISLDNAGIYRSERWLVRGVSMSVAPGEIVTLIGPNGSGKSTTAKMALGVLDADEGSVHRKANLRASYLPQKLDVNWTLPLSVGRFLRLTNRASRKEMEAALSADRDASSCRRADEQAVRWGVSACSACPGDPAIT
jgi:zinc transport system ATP-binding protein